jgi:O-antigen/teichoic acid export membrane protein
MEQAETFAQIKRKTLISALSLFFQSGYSAFLGLAANLVVTILLTPKIFGMYITTLSLISMLNYFSDIGLAASLVQKKVVSYDDVKTTFTVQQCMIIGAVSLGFFVTDFVREFYELPREGVYLYWALLISFFISSLKTIPSIFLERKIKFQRIVLVQVVENTVFYLSVIILAIFKYELRSFTVAVLLRSVTGLVLIYILSPWSPAVGVSKQSLKQLLSFGLPFQASSFLALFKDDLIILFLGKILGFEALGYIGWAKKWAEAPIRIIMDNIGRVLFPVISRIQHDKEQIGKVIDRILYYQTLALAPTLMAMAIFMQKIVYIIPKYSKWAPALPLFYIFCLASLFSSYSSPFMNLFNALGKVKITFSLMFVWTLSTWILTPFFTRLFGYYGFPYVLLLIASSSAVVSFIAKRFVEFHFFKSIYKSLTAALFMGVVLFFVSRTVPHIYGDLIVSVLLGALTYYGTLLLFFKINLVKELRSLFIK